MIAIIRLVSYWVLDFVNKSSKSSHILSHPLSSWANSRTSWGMWWCALHHHGPQGAYHDIPSKAHPLTSLLEHKDNFAYTTILHFRKWKWDLIPFWMSYFLSLANSSRWLPSQTSFWNFVSPIYTTLSWCFRLKASGTMFPFRGLCRMCPRWKRPMCLAISFVLRTTWVEWQSTSRSHCRSAPPHPWSLCNGPKFWDNVSWPTFLFHGLATFVLSHSTSCFQKPPAFHLALGFLLWQSQTHRNGFQNPCQNRATSTRALSPKCLSRFQRLHCMPPPIHKSPMTSSKGLSKVWLSLQSSWWTYDNKRLILKRILRLELT